MRRKLLLTVALAVLGTAITAGVVNAQSGVQTASGTGSPRRAEPASRQLLPRLLGPEGRRRRRPDRPRRSRLLRSTRHRRVGHGAAAPTTAPTPVPAAAAPAAAATAPAPAAAPAAPATAADGRLHRRRRRSRAGRPADRAATEHPAAATNGSGGTSAGSGQQDTPAHHQPTRKPNGVPTKANPTLTVADFGPAPLGVPNFLIDQFSIPPFLLPIYQACGTQYGIPWEVLAAINRIETAFGTNLNVSTAGAVGWMQFMPSTWKTYGVDANGDGRKDPYNPVDAICAAARYLKAAGGDSDLRTAIFAYNHADWYVDEVLLYARQYGKLPEDLVGSLTGLTQGDRFPVAANARYADDISERDAAKRAKPSKGASGNVADVISSSPTRRGINIYSHDGAPVVAVNDGIIKRIGHNKKLGNYIVLQDDYGNRFTYAAARPRLEGLPGAEAAQALGRRLQARHPEEGQGAEPARHARQAAGRQAGGSAASDAAKKHAKPPKRRPRTSRPAPPRRRRTPRTCGSGSTPCPSAPTTSTAPASRASSISCCRRSSPATRPSSPTSAACSTSTAARWSCGRSARARRSSPAPSSAGSGRPTSSRRT